MLDFNENRVLEDAITLLKIHPATTTGPAPLTLLRLFQGTNKENSGEARSKAKTTH
jgi:hypothetical protein